LRQQKQNVDKRYISGIKMGR
jgi:hypothetical protein